MPVYFFNARINNELILDPEGQDLSDPDQAWIAARAAIREMIHSGDASPGLLRSVMEVTDHHGDIVFEYPFSEALGEAP